MFSDLNTHPLLESLPTLRRPELSNRIDHHIHCFSCQKLLLQANFKRSVKWWNALMFYVLQGLPIFFDPNDVGNFLIDCMIIPFWTFFWKIRRCYTPWYKSPGWWAEMAGSCAGFQNASVLPSPHSVPLHCYADLCRYFTLRLFIPAPRIFLLRTHFSFSD